MAKGVNKAIILGALGSKPEIKYTTAGKAVTSFSVATSDKWKDKQTGEQKENTEWHRVVVYDKLAEIACQYLDKGSKVYLEGELRTRQWEKDGQKHYATEIIVKEIQFLDSKPQAQPDPYFDQQRQHQQKRQAQDIPGFDDQSIPF